MISLRSILLKGRLIIPSDIDLREWREPSDILLYLAGVRA